MGFHGHRGLCDQYVTTIVLELRRVMVLMGRRNIFLKGRKKDEEKKTVVDFCDRVSGNNCISQFRCNEVSEKDK